MTDNQTTAGNIVIKKRTLDGLRLRTGPVTQAALDRLQARDRARDAMAWTHRVQMKSGDGWFKWLSGNIGEPGVRWSVEIAGNSAVAKFKQEKDWLMFEWMFNHRLPLASELRISHHG